MNPEKVLEDKPLAYYQFNEVPGGTAIDSKDKRNLWKTQVVNERGGSRI